LGYAANWACVDPGPRLLRFICWNVPSFYFLRSRWGRWFPGGGAALSGGGGGGAGVLAHAGTRWCLFLPVVEARLGWSRRRCPADGPIRRPFSLRPSLLVRAAAVEQGCSRRQGRAGGCFYRWWTRVGSAPAGGALHLGCSRVPAL
jgi:hypothetical protein